jgi:hypothetical protein
LTVIVPKVRQMIVCEDARTRPGSRGKIDIFGIMNKVGAREFPCQHSFAVFLCLTDGRGAGQGRIVVTKGIDEEEIYSGDLHDFEFGNDPLPLHPCLIRVFACQLPGPGLYLVKFVYNDVVLESCAMLIEEST